MDKRKKVTEYYNLLLDILKSKDEEYEKLHPEIKERNVFSISTLSDSSAKQVHWKLNGKRKTSYVKLSLTMGKALHEFIQRRFMFVANEYPVMWANERFILLGHCDIVDFKNNVILEIKTTSKENIVECRLKEYTTQLGSYCVVMEKETKEKFRGILFIINIKTNELLEYELTQKDKRESWKIILQRAEETYQKIFSSLPEEKKLSDNNKDLPVSPSKTN